MRLLYTVLFGAILALGGCASSDEPEPSAPPVERPAPDDAEARVIVHLFEWRWDDIAEECETVLGPMGYDAVQVSPVTENARVDDPPRPWWERYQPVSYEVGNRSGSRAAFAEMTERCEAAGVKVYADVVLNHMTGVYSGESINGTAFGEYDYPGLYGYDDFHHCGLTDGDEIQVWDDSVQVRRCELVNLADLATGKENVRDTLAAFLNDLVSLGVDGFRVDAARHMAPEDLAAILSRVDGEPFVYQEVIDPAPPSWSERYYPMGHVTEFQYSGAISDVFFNRDLADLHPDSSFWNDTPFLPSEQALVFINNHDNQRGHGAGGHIITFKDGPVHDLATVFMLAYPYGTPRVMSSYAFEDGAQGPPTAEGSETIARVNGADGLGCGDEAWICEHRRPAVAGMARFRSVVAGAPVLHWWTDGADQIAFSRGDRGFVAINRDEEEALAQTLMTNLPDGTYCDVTDGGLTEDGTGCMGASVTVGEDGRATFSIAPLEAIAIHVESRLGP